MAIVLFWVSVLLVAYAYAGYPLLVALLARRIGRPPRIGSDCPPLTVVVAACNEQARIAARIDDILAQDYPAGRLQVLVVSDGSSDDTVAVAHGMARRDACITVLELPVNRGKAAALNQALLTVRDELVAFTDARQRFAPGALRALVAPFADASVGAVTGELRIAGDDGQPTAEGMGLYWKMETRLRSDEALLGWLHGVTGAIHAMRRSAFVPLPAGTLLDDMWLPLHVALAGQRVWMTRDAVAWDQGSATAHEEFSRKLRTLAGNWQLIARMPVLLDPLRNALFLPWLSHKLLRLVVPWALLLALACSALAPGRFYAWALVAQVLGYSAAVLALCLPRAAARVPLLPAAASFVLLNAAALLSLPASLAWQPARLWRKH